MRNGFNTPKLSVLMAVHNGEKFLTPAISSIVKQSFRDFELILIDDGSTDRTPAIIHNFLKKDKRIRFYRQQKKEGLIFSLNRGISLARGYYIARMDADDIALPQRLEVQVDFLDKNPNCAFCGTWCYVINEKGEIVGHIRFPTDERIIKRIVMLYNPFIHPSLCFRKEVLKQIGGYDESFRLAQDYDLILRLMARYKGVNIPQFLLKYRQSNYCVSWKNMRKSLGLALRARWKALRRRDYPCWQVIYLIKPCISYLIPIRLKLFILRLKQNFKI